MPRGDESTDSGSDRDSYSSDSAETEEDYERKDEDVDMELPFTKLLRWMTRPLHFGCLRRL